MKWKYITADPNVCGGKPCFRFLTFDSDFSNILRSKG